jgi:hypothetical protein
MEKIDVQSTSAHSAKCSDIILRQTDRVRLLFRPEIVDNADNPDARVRGRFLYQRKGIADSWEKFDGVSIGTLRKGEGYQLELHSEEVYTLRRDLYELAQLHRSQGIPQGHTQFLKVKDVLADLLELTQPELREFLSANKADAIKVFARVVHWLASTPDIASQLALDETQLPTLNAIVSQANLRAISKLWMESSENDAEEFWQRELGHHAFVLGLLLAYPVVIIKEKAYVGGKRFDNKHGSIVDFLARIPTSRSAVLVEIKTPMTQLLGTPYRADVIPPSTDLIGAISQVLHYRESLTHESNVGDGAILAPSEPRCLVIIGSSGQLADDLRKRSFERFRERLLGVTVVTFDELFHRVRELSSLFD